LPAVQVSVTYTVQLMRIPGIMPASLAITRTVELPVRNWKMVKRSQAGQAMIEFVFVSIFLICILISIVSISVGMWQYHTLAEAVNVTARVAAVHGAGCAGQTCATTVDQIARTLKSRAIGIPAQQINATLTSSASTVTCNPLSTCVGNSASWPSLSGNTSLATTTPTNVSIVATFQFTDPVLVWVPGHGTQKIGSFTFGAQATQPVIYWERSQCKKKTAALVRRL
jgi:hypothetical protein